MPTGTVPDPYGNYNFLVEIDGIARASFQECSGFDSTTDVTEYREGGENLSPRKLPGLTKFGNITLKWGMTDDRELYDWHRSTVEGDNQRRNGSIVLVDSQKREKRRWNFERAWVTKWDGPDFNAQSSDIAIEMVEITVEDLKEA